MKGMANVCTNIHTYIQYTKRGRVSTKKDILFFFFLFIDAVALVGLDPCGTSFYLGAKQRVRLSYPSR